MTIFAVPDERQQRIAEAQPAFADLIGFRLVSVAHDLVVAELTVDEKLSNRNGVLHGGALMALADNLGGTATALVLPRGARTTTVESKTNFLRAVPVGQTVRAECTYLHRGRTTVVVQTDILQADGKLAARVTQTQLVMLKPVQPPA